MKKDMNNFHLYNGDTFIADYETECEGIDAANALPAIQQGYWLYNINEGTAWNGPRPKLPPQ